MTGVQRNPMPPRSLMAVEKNTRGWSEEQCALLLAAIGQRFAKDRNAKRDHVLIKGSYLLGCRVSGVWATVWFEHQFAHDLAHAT